MTPSALARWDKRYLWHPFTQQAEWAKRDPLIITSGRGVWLRDAKGRRLLDGNSSLWVNAWGHHDPALNRAVQRQLEKIAHCTFLGLTHEPAIRLAKRLVELAPPGLTRVFYSDNGSTAVEVALKMAYQYGQLTGRPKKSKFVSLKEGYHGDTLGSVSVGGVALFHERFKKLLFSGFHVTPGNFDELRRVLSRHHRSIAAMVMEPLIQGASGMRVMPKGYLAEAARLCRRYDVLLVLDEVATGFGRTGTMFACEREKAAPDFLCAAKTLTGGYLPLAVTLAREKIFRAFLGRYDEFKTFFHGHTYTANPLACAVALENLRRYTPRSFAIIRRRAEEMRRGLEPLRNHPHVKEIRQIGLMAGIELIRDKAKNLAYPAGMRMGLKGCDAAIRRGVWIRPLGDVLVLMPPLAISAPDMRFLTQTVCEAIDEATKS